MSAPRTDSPGARGAGASASRAESRAGGWIEGALLALVVALLYALGGEALRASYHGYLHATIGEAVLREGLVPENPWHAGAPLRYYTLYPLLGVLLGRSGCGPLWAFAALNVLAALLTGPALDALGRSLGLRAGARRAAFLAAVLGFNGLGWIGFVVLSAPPGNPAPVFATLPAVFGGTSFGWDARLQAFLPKYLNASSYALALPFALWALAQAGAARASAGRPWRALAPLALSSALNPLVGGFAVLVLVVWLAPATLRARGRERWSWPLVLALAGLLAAPFVLAVLQPAPRGEPLLGEPALGGSPLANLVGPLVLLVPFALAGLRGRGALAPGVRWRWGAAVALAAAVVVVGEMPYGNEYKFARLGALLWALPAGVALARLGERGARARAALAALAFVCLPTSVLVARAYVRWGERAPPFPLRVEHGALAPDLALEPRAPSAALLAAEARQDPRAVLVLHPGHPGARVAGELVQGNALAPVLHHALAVDLPQIHNQGQPDLARRLELVHALHGSGWPADAPARVAPEQALEELRTLFAARPLLVVAHASETVLLAALAARGSRVLADPSGFELWLVPAARP